MDDWALKLTKMQKISSDKTVTFTQFHIRNGIAKEVMPHYSGKRF